MSLKLGTILYKVSHFIYLGLIPLTNPLDYINHIRAENRELDGEFRIMILRDSSNLT